MAITDKKISTIYNGRDISSLSDRPNQDGMKSPELKARFDQLGKEVIPKINDLIDELFADFYSGTEQTGHTHNIDNLVDGITYKLFTAVERAKLGAISEGAEVNQNAFSNVKVGSTTIASTTKTDTFELVAGLNITMTVDTLTKKVFFSATGDLATEAVQSLIVDIGNYYEALNVEDALQEIGYALANLSGNAEDIAITDVGEYFTSENVEGALQEVGAKLSPSDSKITPVDADTLLISDSVDSSIFKKLSWANIKATLKTYFDTLYQSVLVSGTNIKSVNGQSLLGSGDIQTLMPKNWIINGMFDVWQRSTSQTTSGYGSDDRFNNINFGSTKTHSQQAFTVGQTAVPNNPKYFSRTVVSSVAGVGNYASKAQRIEDVVKLAGKTITFSFWAKADANKNMAIEFVQSFGSGGSDSVVGIGVQKFALTSSWQKFTKTITLPSVSGKTIGIDNYLALSFWFDAGSDFNARTDSLGNQSGTFDIANVSLVEGSVAVECQNQPYDEVLEQCLRYYVRYDSTSQYVRFCMGTANGTTQCVLLMPLFKKMRTPNPAIEAVNLQLFDGVNATNVVSSIGYADSISLSHAYMVAVTTGLTQYRTYYLLTTNSSGYLAFSSEL